MNNYKKGRSAEYTYMYKHWLFRFSGQRSFGSKGIFDCIFIDKNYVTHLVQVKKATKKTTKPKIDKASLFDIQTYIEQFDLKGKEHIWVGYVLIPYRQEPIKVRMN